VLQGFVPWPDELARRYVEAGLWEGITVAEMVERSAQRQPHKVAIVHGETPIAPLRSGGSLTAFARRVTGTTPRPAHSGATKTVAQQIVLRQNTDMPVAVAQKVKTLSVDFRSSARLADLLGVSRSQVTRWLRGAGIDPLNAEKVDLLELVWSSVLRIYDQDAALAWLFGVNPLLGDRRPVDLIRQGRTEELMRAVRAERSDTFR
jgi:uncharacterized protein (DUF2384 family)